MLKLNAFFNNQFNYASLFWVFTGESSILKMCKIYFQTLQAIYNNYDKSYHDLLNFSNGFSVHQRHLRFIAIEVYKSIINMNPEFMWKFFSKNLVQYN